MIFAYLYFVFLFIAPQLWVPALMDLPTDYILLPLWTVYIMFKGKPIRFISSDKLLLFWYIWIVLSLLFNDSLTMTVTSMGMVTIFYFKLVWVYFLVSNTIENMHQLRSLIGFYLIIAIALSVEGIQHKLTGIGWAGQPLGWIDLSVIEAGGSGRTKWIGIFDGPGVFGVVYAIAFPFLLERTTSLYSFPRRLIAASSLCLMCAAIFFNGSRGTMLAVLGMIFMFFNRNFKKTKKNILIGIGIALLFFVAAPSYLTTMNDQQKSGSNRVDMWGEGIEMAQQNPVFGIGRGNFINYTYKLIAHNSAIELMGETGLPGLFLWFSLIFMSVKNVAAGIRQSTDEKERQFLSTLAISLLGYIICSMFVTLEYETHYILLALCSSVGKFYNPAPIVTKEDIIYIAGGTIGFFVVIKLFVMFFFGIN